MNKKVEVKKAEDGEVELNIEVAWEDFNKFWPQAIKTLSSDAKVDGFRPGKIPEKVLLEKIGEGAVLFEMAEIIFREIYHEILSEEKIDAIGRPEVSITKIAKDNPLSLTVKTATVPEITLPDYKALAKVAVSENNEEVLVTDEEVTKTMNEIWKQKNQKPDTKDEDIKIDDEFAKTLGDFKTAEALRAKIKENMLLEKKAKLKERKRVSILESLDKGTEIKIPPILIDKEVEKMQMELQSEIERMGLKFPDYLSHLKKTEKELKEGFQTDARKRVATGLIIGRIAKEEKIVATDEEIKKEIDHIKQHNPEVNEASAKNYLEGALINEKTIAFLEEQK